MATFVVQKNSIVQTHELKGNPSVIRIGDTVCERDKSSKNYTIAEIDDKTGKTFVEAEDGYCQWTPTKELYEVSI